MEFLIAFGLFLQGCYSLKMVDLSYELDSGTITWPSNPRFNMSIMHRGFWTTHLWLENNRIDLAEHTGTHIDAPNHLANEAGNWNNHQIPIERLGGPGVIINVKSKAEANSDYRVTVDDLKAWEARNGRIPYGAVVLMNSGWQKYYPDYNAVFKTNNISDSNTYHFPSWHEDAVDWLISNRVVYCVGVDTPSTDYGQSQTFPVHVLLSKENIIGIESAAYLDKLPESGSTIFVPVLKIRNGSGGPARMFALLPDMDVAEANKAVINVLSPMLQLALLLLLGVLHF
ncbi:isatin hydrolase-like isoform X2 [Pecten maximus]|uniref:isatin hydrolase-like isoform X1 n=1 Tax=Pecten maximus TaxID=6579 RepID=UPI001458DC93|nr:isatin hydrolase-like isoform X1 [Pecten maximus]XP_033724651.1 isatin hydrolase-like isoform X2 [Pecten maximus]